MFWIQIFPKKNGNRKETPTIFKINLLNDDSMTTRNRERQKCGSYSNTELPLMLDINLAPGQTKIKKS